MRCDTGALFDFENERKLFSLISNHGDVDFYSYNLKKKDWEKAFNWNAYFDNFQTFRTLIYAYQRLLRVLPEGNQEIIAHLLRNNIHSALQISSMPFERFCRLWVDMNEETRELLRTAYKNSLQRKSMTTLQYINHLQKNEPHFKNANFNK